SPSTFSSTTGDIEIGSPSRPQCLCLILFGKWHAKQNPSVIIERRRHQLVPRFPEYPIHRLHGRHRELRFRLGNVSPQGVINHADYNLRTAFRSLGSTHQGNDGLPCSWWPGDECDAIERNFEVQPSLLRSHTRVTWDLHVRSLRVGLPSHRD